MVNLWDNNQDEQVGFRSSLGVSSPAIDALGNQGVGVSAGFNVDAVDLAQPNVQEQLTKMRNDLITASGGLLGPDVFDGLSEYELRQIHPASISNAMSRVVSGEKVDTAGMPPAIAQAVEKAQQAAAEQKQVQAGLSSAFIGATASDISFESPFASATPTANPSRLETSKAKADPQHPFAFLEEILAPIKALFEQMNKIASGQQPLQQGVDVSRGNLGAMTPSSLPGTGRTQELQGRG